MNNDPVLELALIGTVLWVVLMTIYELPRFRNAYYKLRPQIKFIPTKHEESGNFEIVDGKRFLIGIGVYLEGYFENSGGSSSTVKAIETKLFKRWGIFKLPVSKEAINAAYYLEGDQNIADVRGVNINEYSISRKVKADSTCLYNNGECRYENLNNDYFIRIRWRVLGQEPKSTEIYPNWENFKKSVKDWLSRPIPGMGDSQT
jgi:hypothetical protein